MQIRPGYAVFSNLGVKILLAGSGSGKGIAVNNKSKKETFMKMLQVQAGLGIGVKKFRVVFVFDNEKALDSFVNAGWQLGGNPQPRPKPRTTGARWRERASGRRDHRHGHQILQRRRPELKARPRNAIQLIVD